MNVDAAEQERKEFNLRTVREVFGLENMFVFLCNLLAFVLLETVFFWFVASHSIDRVVEEQAIVFSNYLIDSKQKDLFIKQYLQNELATQILPERAKEVRDKREKDNWNLVMTYIFPIVVALGIVIVLVRLFLFLRGKPLTTIDYFLLFLVLTSFSTELYFYLTVSSQIIFFPTASLLESLYNSFLYSA